MEEHVEDAMLADYLHETPLWLRLQQLEGERGHEGVTRLPGKGKMTMESMSEEEFRNHFRMTKAAFTLLHEKLKSCAGYCTEYPEPGTGLCSSAVLPPKTRILIALWYLASEDSYRSIAKHFDVTESTAHDAVSSCLVMMKQLKSSLIAWPNHDEQEQEMRTFFDRTGFPGVVGCVDGTHVEVVTGDDTYYNRKRFSINVMLTVNSQEQVIHLNVESPGSYHDARAFCRSGLPELVEGLPSDRHLLGDSAYGLSIGLLTPYVSTGKLTAAEKHFNYKLSSTRMIIGNAIARLKNKWRRLVKTYTRTIKRAEDIIVACVVLHNFLMKYDSELCSSKYEHMKMPTCATGEEKRKFIAQYLKR